MAVQSQDMLHVFVFKEFVQKRASYATTAIDIDNNIVELTVTDGQHVKLQNQMFYSLRNVSFNASGGSGSSEETVLHVFVNSKTKVRQS